MTATNSLAADKAKVRAQIDGASSALEAFIAKSGDNREVSKDLDQAHHQITRAFETFEKGGQLFGLAGIKPEAEQEITHYLNLSDLYLTIAGYRVEKSNAAKELETLEKNLAAVMSKIKVFEDRKSEFDKLKGDAAKYQAAAKEVEVLKGDKRLLNAETERLSLEVKKLSEQLAEAKKNATLPKVEPKAAPDPPKEAPTDKK